MTVAEHGSDWSCQHGTSSVTAVYLPLSVKSVTLTTDDAFWRCQFLAACYQLAQSVLKIGSALAERVGQGEVGGCTALADSAWWPLQLPVEKPWSMPGGPFVCLLAQTGIENAPFTLYRLHFWHFRQLLVRRSILWSEGPDY